MFRFGDPGGRMYTSVGTSNVNLLAHWTSVNGTFAVSAGNGRTSGSSLRMSVANFTPTNLVKSLDAQQTWGVAFAFRAVTIPSSANIQICRFIDSGSLQIDLRLLTTGFLQVTRNGTVLGTSSSAISVNSYYHIEIKVKIDPSVGTVEVRVNGSAVIGPLTGQNTRATANSTANQVSIGDSTGSSQTGSTGPLDFDDIIVYDGQTTDPSGNAAMTGFIGDCGLSWLLPTGAGNTTQFTPDSGSNWARVSEATPDTTSYVESSTVGQKDTYTLADLAASVALVKAVAVCHFAEKTDVGGRQMGAVIRSGGTDYTHTTGIDLGNSYLYSFRNWDSNPSGGVAWTPTTVNALEIGQVVNT